MVIVFQRWSAFFDLHMFTIIDYRCSLSCFIFCLYRITVNHFCGVLPLLQLLLASPQFLHGLQLHQVQRHQVKRALFGMNQLVLL